MLGALVELLLPGCCPACRFQVDEPGYCPDCASRLARHGPQCPRCGVPCPGGRICGRCQTEPAPVDETIAPFKHAPPLSQAIHRLKYHRRLACGRDLGHLLAGELKGRVSRPPEVLVPVPLHWRRRSRRGFNQSLEIALPISRVLGIPIDPGLVRRRAHTAPQVGLVPDRRRRNLRRAFASSGRRAPADVAIVDDVVTSGATVRELAWCLRRAGAERVVVWAVTRA